MAEPSDALDRWRELHTLFTIKGDPARTYPPPSPADLDRFESETGVKLPGSYRAYCQVFGAGVFDLDPVYLSVRAPYCPRPEFDLGGAFAINENFKKDRSIGERARRLVYVGSSFSGDLFGWDPAESTDAAAPEFALYCAIRHGDVVKLADNFYDFINVCTDRAAFKRLTEGETQTKVSRHSHLQRTPKRVFAPVSPDFI